MAIFDFKKTEEKVLKFWQDHKIFEKTLLDRQKGKKFVFFEGPPTANGRPGMHHFIGRAYKDVFNRFRTMQGYFVLRKAGWDTHGLPVELQVEKELGFKTKKDIEAYGIAEFNKKCKQSVWQYKKEWEEFTQRMGFWVDLDDPYVTYENKYIESIWNILKTIWDKKLLYQAHKVVPFCTRCGTPLSSHEVAQGYKTVKERSVYLKFKVKEGKGKIKKGDYILAWTTTPWTLLGNVALAVGENIEYILIKNGKDRLVVAKELAQKVVGEYTELAVMTGKDLEGIEYEPLFDVPPLKSETSYKVYLADFVSTADGTGVVHTAVMYGEDDYRLGDQVGLPKIHTVDEAGKFFGVGNGLDGKYTKGKETEETIVKMLSENGNLLKEEMYEHEYPFCWRCATPLLYYAKTSWFIRMSILREQLIKNNQTINWVPDHIKEGRFGQWLKDNKDWAISRERYWGTPLPLFSCVKCENMTMAGSFEQLEKESVNSGNRYFFMRHGATTRHEKTKIIIGSRLEDDKYNLTKEGQEQAQKSAEKLSMVEDKIDYIFASPFKRTLETAQIAGKLFHKEIKTDERLSEIRHGIACEGKHPQPCQTREGRESFDKKDIDGESYNEMRRRVADFMCEMESKYKDKKILIVTHGDISWMADKVADGMNEKEIVNLTPDRDGWYPHLAEIKEIKWRALPRNEYGEMDPHRPFVDDITIKCNKCGAGMKRIPDLIDVWFDSGSMPYAQWHWPQENEKTFKEQFPADFICEGIDQTRGWFYTLLAISTLMDKGAPYKNVLCYSHVLDDKGMKMSKSKGNIVAPGEVMEKFGVDTARWYFYTINSPGDYKLYSEKDLKERLSGFMSTLQNCMNFYELYRSDKANEKVKEKGMLDKWIMSRLNGLIDLATRGLEAYDFVAPARAIEKFVVDDFSNWWLRRSRKRDDALPMLRHILLEISKLTAPFTPFVAEDVYMRLNGVSEGPESVHLALWPKYNPKKINLDLESEMQRVREIINAGLAVRKDKQIKVRQPLAKVTAAGKKFHQDLEHLIKEELNIKKIEYKKSGETELDLEITSELMSEGYSREVMRQIQDMRKEVKYRFDEKVYGQWFSEDEELSSAIIKWSDKIKEDTILSDLIKLERDSKTYDIQKDVDIAPGKKLWLGLRK